jgi:predicted DNA-binding transcriptional regulator YafY
VGDLAVRFGISRRTVYRDLRLLAAADVPLMRRARDGCYHVAAPVAS